jgi:hypothetical protein
MAEVADGPRGVLAVSGPRGSGRTQLATAAAREGARRGFGGLRAATIGDQPCQLISARVLANAGAPDDLVSQVLGDAAPLAQCRARS